MGSYFEIQTGGTYMLEFWQELAREICRLKFQNFGISWVKDFAQYFFVCKILAGIDFAF